MSNNVRILTLFLPALIWAGSVIGASLAGVVQDPQSQVVPGASITLFSRSGGATAATTSDASGAYRFDGLPAGDYLLRAEAPGFAVLLADDVRLAGDAAQSRDLSLQLAGVREQVVVTASGTSQTLAEVSKAVTVVDRTEAEQRDAFTISDVVSLAPGVRVQPLGGPGQVTSIRIRGMRDLDTAVVIDGLRLRDAGALHGDASGLIQDLLFTDSSRIEVMNGAASSLYGTNAIGGVVNVLTDEGGGRTRGSLLAEGGSLGTMRGRATLAGALVRDRIQYSAGLAHVDVTSGVDGDDPFRDTSFQGRVSFRLSPSAQLSARLYAGDAFVKLNASPALTGVLPPTGIVNAVPGTTFLPSADDPDSTAARRFLDGALTFDGQPSSALHYSLSFQTLASSRRYGNGPAGPGFQPAGSTRSVYDGRIQTVNAHLDYTLGRSQLLTGGYEFENENFAFDFADRSNPKGASGVNVTQSSNTLFLQDQVRLLDGRFQVTGGFRAQYFSLDRPLFSPVASAPYQGIAFVSPPAAYTGDGSAAYFFRATNTKLRGHVGRGYRAPSLFERFGTGFSSTFGYSIYGDPRLEPERSIAFDAGLDQTFARGRARVSATYFYTRLQQIIGFGTPQGTDPFGRFSGYENLQGGLSRGAELSATISPTRSLNLSAAYTFVNAAERTPVVAPILRTFVIPRHQFSATAAQRIGPRVLLTFDTLDSGDYLAPVFGDGSSPNFFAERALRFDGVRRVNAGASYRLPLGEFKAVRFYVRGENLLDQDYFESGFRTPGRTAVGGMQLEF
jgi:iron complex outermembrane receptor protein